ncbi:MAG: hypothetical protein MJZ22_02965 [Candidatus Saccharibacteria bacterium]|nr:hypothetical protein [Candidatus Saccharibacteria bacterium]
MKNKRIGALALASIMAFGMTGCTKIEKVSKKDFVKACEEAGYDEDDIYEEDLEDEGLSYFGGIEDDDIALIYIEYEDEDDALERFDDLLDDFEDADKNGSSKYAFMSNKYYGYFVLNGEIEDWDAIDFEGDAYIGVYYADDTIVMALANSDSKKDKEVIDDFVESLGYPNP